MLNGRVCATVLGIVISFSSFGQELSKQESKLVGTWSFMYVIVDFEELGGIQQVTTFYFDTLFFNTDRNYHFQTHFEARRGKWSIDENDSLRFFDTMISPFEKNTEEIPIDDYRIKIVKLSKARLKMLHPYNIVLPGIPGKEKTLRQEQLVFFRKVK